MPNICATCTNITEEPYTICEHCEIQHTISLLHVYTMLEPLRLLVDASIHVGDNTHHHGSDIAPTPVRLPVLDLLDLVDAIISGYYARLHPPTSRIARQQPDLESTILAITSDDRLTQLPDIGMYMAEITMLEQRMSIMLHDHERKQPIGHCLNPLCGVTVYASDSERTVTCPTCSMVQTVDDVRLAFWTQCLNNTKLVTSTQAASIISMCGINITASAIRQWYHRGKLQQVDGLYRLCDVVAVAQSRTLA